MQRKTYNKDTAAVFHAEKDDAAGDDRLPKDRKSTHIMLFQNPQCHTQ